MSYRLVADSSSNVYQLDDFPYACVPLTVHAGGREFADTPALDIPDMIGYLKGCKSRSGTSCPNAYDWMNAFGDAEVVLGVSITSGLSGSYAASQQACRDYLEEHPNAQVYIHDSLSAGPELVLHMERMQAHLLSGTPFEEIVADLQSYSRHTHLFFSLESLTNLANNGRCSHITAKLAGILGIRLVGKASDAGTLEPMHKCRGENKALLTIATDMEEAGFAGGKVRIAHCRNEAAALALRNILLERHPGSDIRIDTCKGLCSYYAEEGGLLVAFEDAL